jgi:acylpyruvate hydrolase
LQLQADRLLESGRAHRLDGVTLGPPVPDPDKIVCVGLNYRAHADEADLKVAGTPVLFSKFRNALIASGDPIRLPTVSNEVDYEGELAVVIGRPCKAVEPQGALEYVAGYVPFNDISARDLQWGTSQWLPGKAADAFAPCGPAVVTADDVEDPQQLRIITRLNGEVMQDASTSLMIFSVASLVSYISTLMTLVPGDIIATGTPAGVGYTRTPPVFLGSGDVVEVEIDQVGRLTNPVANATRSDPLYPGWGSTENVFGRSGPCGGGVR